MIKDLDINKSFDEEIDDGHPLGEIDQLDVMDKIKDTTSEQKQVSASSNNFNSSKPFLVRGRSPLRAKMAASHEKIADNKSSRGMSQEKKNVTERNRSP